MEIRKTIQYQSFLYVNINIGRRIERFEDFIYHLYAWSYLNPNEMRKFAA